MTPIRLAVYDDIFDISGITFTQTLHHARLRREIKHLGEIHQIRKIRGLHYPRPIGRRYDNQGFGILIFTRVKNAPGGLSRHLPVHLIIDILRDRINHIDECHIGIAFHLTQRHQSLGIGVDNRQIRLRGIEYPGFLVCHDIPHPIFPGSGLDFNIQIFLAGKRVRSQDRIHLPDIPEILVTFLREIPFRVDCHRDFQRGELFHDVLSLNPLNDQIIQRRIIIIPFIFRTGSYTKPQDTPYNQLNFFHRFLILDFISKAQWQFRPRRKSDNFHRNSYPYI